MKPDRSYIVQTLRDLVAINSINPALSEGDTGERQVAERIAAQARALDLDVELLEFAPGRTSVIATLRGAGGGRSLMFNGHIDTVGVSGMEAPFEPQERDGLMFGRGTYDMKGGVAACLGAVKALRDAGVQLDGDVVLTAVADEETESRGMQQVLEHVRTDAAIVTEATELDVCIAHKGFCWLEVVVTGRAAHGSKHLEGIDANMRMGQVLQGLSVLRERLLERTHPLLGPATLHAPLIRGGSGISTYASECILQIERRTLPGETEADVVREIEDLLADARSATLGFDGRVRSLLFRPPLETAEDAAIVTAVRGAAESALGKPPQSMGHSFWMDAALLHSAGVETVIIGPRGAGAHADDEHVDIESVVQLAGILAGAAVQYCGANGSRRRGRE